MANAAAFSGGYVANLGPSEDGFLLPAVDQEAVLLGRQASGASSSRPARTAAISATPHGPCARRATPRRGLEEVPGKGTVWSFVVPHPPLLEPYSSLAPYNVIVVALDEHPTIRFVGNLVSGADGALNEIDPNSIRIGEPVEVVFKHFRRADGSEEALPFWVRA